MSHRPARAATLALAGLALFAAAGCGSNTPIAVNTVVATQADADDVAMQAAVSFANVSAVADGGLAGAQSVSTAVRTPIRYPRGSGSTAFVETWSDTTFARGDVTFELHRAFFDLAGNAQVFPDATTDSVVVTSRASGTDSTSSAQWRASVGHAGALDAGGLNPIHDTFHLAGAWSDTLTTHFTSLSGGTTVDCYAQTHGVGAGIDLPKAATYPSDGTITWTIYAQRLRNGQRVSVEKTLQALVVITFNGTRYPIVTVNGTWSYTLDLDTHTLARAGVA
jgi:hypothetical protein